MKPDTEISRYPRQIAVVKRREITLGIDANLELAGAAKNSRRETIIIPPLTMHGPRSCFQWTLVDKSGSETVYPSANLPCGEVAVLRTKVNAVITHNTVSPVRKQTAGKPQSPAYTVTIRMKEFKGRTPAAILLEDAGNVEGLQNIAEYLQNQGASSRYREGNLQQIQAIEEAIALLEKGELSAESASNRNEPIEVYHRPQKVLLNRPAKEDRYFVYSFKIECIPGYTYPWAVSISNAYMKIRKKSDGTHETIPGTAIGRSVSQIQLSDYEMGYLVDRMHSTMSNFELIYFKSQYLESIRQNEALLHDLHGGNSQSRAA